VSNTTLSNPLYSGLAAPRHKLPLSGDPGGISSISCLFNVFYKSLFTKKTKKEEE
jgi:hypothetical protein